jgi:hypothetical protein
MEKAEPTDFDFSLLEDCLEFYKEKITINPAKLRSKGEYDESKKSVTLTDGDNVTICIDNQTKQGFWLEDIVMCNVAKYQNEVYRNVRINKPDWHEQFQYGLERILQSKRPEIKPFIREGIINYLSYDPWERKNKKKNKNISIVGMMSNIDSDLENEIMNVGSENEYDGIILTDDEYTVIEIKDRRPTIVDVAKLANLLPKHFAPLKKRGLLIHSWHPQSEVSQLEFKEELQNWRVLFPNITLIPWTRYFPQLKKPEYRW